MKIAAQLVAKLGSFKIEFATCGGRASFTLSLSWRFISYCDIFLRRPFDTRAVCSSPAHHCPTCRRLRDGSRARETRNILSDLHLSRAALALPKNDAGVAVLAGTLPARGRQSPGRQALPAPRRLRSRQPRVLRWQPSGTVAALRQECAGTNIHVLDNDEVTIDGVRFRGTTLWTDFMLFGEGEARRAAMEEAQRFMRDFSRIRVGDARMRCSPPPIPRRYSTSTPGGSSASSTEPYDGRDGGRHPPCAASRKSIHPRFADSFAECVASCPMRSTCWMEPARASGYTDIPTTASTIVLNGVRVVCNPRGYAENGVN